MFVGQTGCYMFMEDTKTFDNGCSTFQCVTDSEDKLAICPKLVLKTTINCFGTK